MFFSVGSSVLWPLGDGATPSDCRRGYRQREVLLTGAHRNGELGRCYAGGRRLDHDVSGLAGCRDGDAAVLARLQIDVQQPLDPVLDRRPARELDGRRRRVIGELLPRLVRIGKVVA